MREWSRDLFWHLVCPCTTTLFHIKASMIEDHDAGEQVSIC